MKRDTSFLLYNGAGGHFRFFIRKAQGSVLRVVRDVRNQRRSPQWDYRIAMMILRATAEIAGIV